MSTNPVVDDSYFFSHLGISKDLWQQLFSYVLQ